MFRLLLSRVILLVLFCFGPEIVISEISESNEHLLQAANEGNLREVRMALKYGASINCRDSKGRTPLMLAVINNRFDVMKDLVIHGAHIEAKTYDGDRSAFLWAVFLGNERIVQFLYANEADINEVNNRGDTPLIIASYMGYGNILQYLIAEGADIHHKTIGRNFTALHFAAFRGQNAIVQILLEHGALVDEVDSDGRTPFMLAALHGNVEMMELLRNPVSSRSNEGREEEEEEDNRFLTSSRKGADITHQDNLGYSSLLICVKSLFVECVTYLIQLGVPVEVFTTEGENVITLAVMTGDLGMVQYVLLQAVELLNRPEVLTRAMEIAEKLPNEEVRQFLGQFGDPVSVVEETRHRTGVSAKVAGNEQLSMKNNGQRKPIHREEEKDGKEDL
jgi:ankyrin repeat protein